MQLNLKLLIFTKASLKSETQSPETGLFLVWYSNGLIFWKPFWIFIFNHLNSGLAQMVESKMAPETSKFEMPSEHRMFWMPFQIWTSKVFRWLMYFKCSILSFSHRVYLKLSLISFKSTK